MPDDSSPYTEEPATGVDRRTFVKGAMGAAAIGVVGASGFGMFKQSAIVKPTTIRNVQYLGARVLTGSPAPRGLPYIPIRVNEEGVVVGVPWDDDEHYLDWYRYCSHENTPGLANPGFTDDNSLEYFMTEEKLIIAGDAARDRWWYADRLGETILARHFADQPYGAGAAFRWRSQGMTGGSVITGIVLKLHPDEFTGVDQATLSRFMDMEHHLIGVSSFCTHFCCVPGWKEDPSADQLGYWDMIFCTCHNSRWDPRQVTDYRFDLRLGEEEGN